MALICNFQVQQFLKVSQLHNIGEAGKWNYILMICSNTVPQPDAYCSSYRLTY